MSLRQASGRGRRNGRTTDVGEGVARGVALDQALSHRTHNLNMNNSTNVMSVEENNDFSSIYLIVGQHAEDYRALLGDFLH